MGRFIISSLARAPRLPAVVLLASAMLAAGCGLPLYVDRALTAVPYRTQSTGRIIVQVSVNGDGPFPFALDTASSGSFVFARLREQLGLPDVADLEANVQGAVASGRFPVVSIDSLKIGAEVLVDSRLIALPGDTDAASGIDGILGVDLLRRYAIGFSVRDSVVRFYEPQIVSEGNYQGWAAIRLEPIRVGISEQPIYFFDVNIAGRVMPALFDLGAGVNIINSAAVERLDLNVSRADADAILSGAIERQSVMAQFDSQGVMTGRVRWRDELFLLADLEVFEALGYQNRPLAILGSGLFTQRDFIIDFARNRLLVRTSMAERDNSPAAERNPEP